MAERILVVEDDEKSRRLLVDVLGHRGYEVDAAAGGEEALRIARERPPRAVLLDVQLPDISGFEVLWRLRQRPGGATLPVVAVTASVMDAERRRITEAGFDAHAPKPVSIQALLGTLRALIERG